MISMKILYLVVFILIVEVKSQAGVMGGIDIEYRSAFDQELYETVNDEEKCNVQLEFLANNPAVALEFQDASGKIPTGFFSGNLADLGDYHLCLAIRHVDINMEIEGKYCMMQYPLKKKQENDNSTGSTGPPNVDFSNITDIFPNITDVFPNITDTSPLLSNRILGDIKQYRSAQRYAQMISGAGQPIVTRVIPISFASALKMSIGTCIPTVCRPRQAIQFFQRRFLGNTGLGDANVTYDEMFCRLPNDKPFSVADYMAIGIFSLIGFLTVISTSYDLYETFVLNKKSSEISPLYRCCSVYTNTQRFLTFNKAPGALECVDGIRAISMLWVIFGHAYCLTMLNFIQNVKAVREWLTSFTSTWVNSAPITVDTFFLLSGILCVYTVIGKISRWRFITSLHLFYVYRIFRILPLLAAVVLLQASLFHRMSDGPMWINMGHLTAMCRKRWWATLLHVQNYVKPIGLCLYQTWYLSVDLQLYLFSPVVLVWLFGSQVIAWCALCTSILVAFALSTTFSFMHNYSAALANPSRMEGLGGYFVDYYMNTLTRASPFFIGMLYGYLLLRCKGKRICIQKILVWIIWILAFLLMAFCIFTTYPIMQEDFHLQMFDNFLNSYMRGIWALAVGWLIFASVHGYGGPINWFLSLQMWKLPARLSYAMYLTHFSIMTVSNGSMVNTLYFTDGNTLYRAMGDLMLTTIAALVLSITIDAPFSTLQKFLLGGYGFGVRHIQMACMCLTMTALFIARSSLGVAVLAMTDVRRRNDTSVTIYEWDKKTQGMILSSFFWGYLIMQIPAGLLAKRYGGKPIVLFSLLANAIICALLPTLAQFGGWPVVCACRVIMGLTQACLFPGFHTLLGRWLPAHEITSYSGLVYGGSQIGTIIALPVSGLLAETAMGWRLIFYVISGVMFLQSVVWVFFAASSPGEHRLMTEEEREYIERGLNAGGSKRNRTPWRYIMRTRALWALVVTHIGCAISYVLFFVDMPTYLERGLQISLKTSASLSALPYIGMFVGNVVSTAVSQKISNKGYLSLLTCRKLFNSIGFLGTAVSLVALAFIGPERKSLAIVTLITALTLSGFFGAGFMMSYLDLSPNYAGVLLSITNFAANFGSVLTPITTSLILRNDPTDISRWRIVFLVVAAICVAANTSFMFCASVKRQQWDDPDFLDNIRADPEEVKPALKKTKEEEATQ